MHTLNRLLGLLVCCAVLAACGGTPTTPAPTAAPAPASPTSAPAATSAPTAVPTATTVPAAGFPVTIENCGRSVTFTQPPERVVTTYQPATDILLALGLTDRIVLAGGNYGAQPIEPLRDAFATLGDRLRQDIPKREELLSVTPDFVFSTDPSYDFSAENGNATREDLATAGVNIYAFEHRCENASGDFTSGQISDGYTDIRNIGRIFGITERAEAYIAQEQARIAAVAERVASLPPTNVIIYGSGEGPLNVYADGLFAELVERAGGVNLFKGLGEDYGPVSAEVFLTKRPDIYVVVGGDADARAKAEFLFTTFPDHPASLAQRVLAVGDTQFYAGASAAFTVEQFARAFHPEAFASASTTTYPVTIENCGRTLTFDAPPERVVSLWQPPTELLLALGVQERIVALAGNYTDLRPDLAPRAEGITVIGTSMAWPAKEVLLSQQPDLVISEGLEGFAYDPAMGYATVAEIEATGAQVISTGGSCTPTDPASQTKSTEAVYKDLAMLGTIFGVSDRAEALIADLKAREAAVLAKVQGLEPVKVAFYNGGDGPVFVLSFGIWADLMKKAGGENVITTEGFQISNEEFAASNPDVILIGIYPGQEAADRIAFLKATFPNVPAVQNDRLVAIPTIDTEASVRVIDGLEQIARALHPEVFE